MEKSNQPLPSPSAPFTCFLIGQDRLLLECASLILQRQGKILGVISPSIQVKDWAQSQAVPWFSALGDVDWPTQSADYLFSIVNNEMIPPAVRSRIDRLAINYHDGPLPRYAGSNATFWAILNGEARHAVSWHAISEQVDAGDLLKQRFFDLQPDETVLSLNLKCIEHAMASFAELLDEIITEQLQRSPQNLALRSYFLRAQKPPDNGWINWHTDAEQLLRLIRATQFGRYRNPVTVPKILVNDTVLVVGALNVLPELSDQPPGTLLEIRQGYWVIATKTRNVKITALNAPREKPREDLEALAHQYQLASGICLPSPQPGQGELLQQFSQRMFGDEAYWIDRLENFQATPVASPLANVDLTRLPAPLFERLKNDDNHSQEASLAVLSAWLIYLRRCTAQTQLAVSVVWETPDLPPGIAPFFASHLPFTVTIDDTQGFDETLKRVRLEYEQIGQHGTYLIDCWQRYPELAGGRTQDPGCQIRIASRVTQDDDSEPSLPQAFLTLLESLLAHPKQPIANAAWVTAAETQQLLIDWNQTETPYPDQQTIHGLFEEQVQKTPDNLALIAPGVRLSYRELNQHANQLAHYLLKGHALVPDQLVAVCLERSQWLLVALLGILKSGAAYVPIDPAYPDNRIRFIVEETKACTIITTSNFAQRLLNLSATDQPSQSVVVLDELVSQPLWQQQSGDNPVTAVGSRHLAYVMYTSGTTGTPKGIQIEHRSIVNRIIWMNRYCPLTSSDRVLQKTPMVFDVSVWELFWAHWTGAAIVLAKPDGHRNLEYLAKIISDEAISIVHFTPTMLSGLVQAIELDAHAGPPTTDRFHQLRYLFCSGEVLHDSTVARAQALLPHVRIVNLYGPTEAAIDVLYYECVKNRSVCLGKPIANTRVYVLDDQQRPLPVGMAGELTLAGDGLARGYLNQPALTAQQFIANPLLSKSEKKRGRFDRLYKTGDLARWLPSGELDYIGRIDRQIKLRGNRIELDEIEQVILRYPSITQCAVVVDDKQLVACYSAVAPVEPANLERHVQDWLPDYMIPHQWVVFEQLPTGISGKIDYRRLMHPAENKTEEAPTRTDIETAMVMAFAAVLGLEPSEISTRDDFFKLGGDSILAIRLVSRINELLNQHLQVRQVFELKTVHALSELIEQTAPTTLIPETPYEPFSLVDTRHYQDLLSKYEIEDIYPASHLQIGMLLESSLNSSGTYHDVFFYEINCRFVEDQFLKTWEALANKHALLRARFFLSEQHALDVAIFKKAQLYFRFYIDQDLQALIDTERLVHFLHSEECLFHLLVNAHAESFELIFSFHHAIVDGWSVASLINEFVQAYACHRPITPAPAKQSRLSYGEFVRNERSRMNDQQSICFWKNYLEDANPAQANWKFDDRTTSQDSLFSSAFHLTPEQTTRTQQLARYTGVNPDTIFLYAYLKTLSFFLNSDDITIGVVFNNRLEKTGGDTLFGVFLNVLPFRQKLDHHKGIQAALLETFANRIKILAHRHIPYARLKSMLRRDLYKFGYNFINFHVLNQSQAWIKRRGGFDRTSIPFFLEVTQNETFKVEIKSHDNYISQDYLQYFLKYFKVSLQNILDGQNKLSLCAQDYQKMILDWNATERTYPKEKTVHRLFEDQVVKTPDAIALVSQNTTLTYQELNRCANRLARYLLTRHQVKPDDLIALFLDRNEWMVISILAVLKSGAAYVPLETTYPEERIKYIISETETRVVLTNIRHKIRLKDQKLGSFLVCVDREDEELYPLDQSELNPLSSVESTNLAYVIYTSGTTGTPNGVMIEHRSVVNTLHALYPVYQCPRNRRATAYTSYVFDVSVAEIFTVLTSGSELHVLDRERSDISQLADYLLRHKINIAYFPPTILSILAKLHYPALEVIIFAGEPCPEAVAQFWAMNHALYNYYGPTEFTIYATGGRVGLNVNNIGMPISNNQVYVLSQDRVPVPFGAVGELHLSGDGAARGYFKNEKLTEEKFIVHTFDGAGQPEHKKLYKTGDLVRWLPGGELEFIGRNDSQVKINGYRIELGEIEHVLNKYPGMKHSAVMVHEHRFNQPSNPRANKYMVGYYLLDSEILDADQHNHLNNWKQLYDLAYADLNQLDYKENTSGWKSSYTGELFSREEMREWREEIVEKIIQLKPKRIVEIGCGTGMLLFSLIEHCDYYFASDLSDSAIQYIRQASLRLGYQDKLTLFTGDAKKIPFFKLDKKFDTAILNSVIQYFPTAVYLDEVLNNLIESIEIPGRIFIGDVRDLRLLHCFKCSVLSAKCSPNIRRQEIDYFVSCEKELLVDPGYFLNLQKNDPRITHVELLPKRGIFPNEMNHYRYDVVLYIGDESVPTLEIELSQTDEVKKFPDILEEQTDDAFAFRYPNKRVLMDYKEYSRIYELPFNFNDQQIDQLLTPNEISTLLQRYGYDTQLYLDLNCPYGLAVAAYKSKKFNSQRIQLQAGGNPSGTSELTNDQILNARLMHDRNGIAIKNYLKTLLPDYMVPNYLFPLTTLSLTASGKLDRSSLPIPEISFVEIIAPRTKMEIDISQIFSEVLGLPLSKIGVKNSFVDMGGNSLSAIVLVSKLNRHFTVELKIGDIVKHKSVEGLSQLLTGLKAVKSK